MRTTLVIWLCLATFACGPGPKPTGDDDGTTDAPPAQGDGNEERCTSIDVLFVIDNSGSMEQEQTNLIANFPTFISVLNNSGLDYRVAVTTTGRNYTWKQQTPFGTVTESQDGGDNGTMLQPASCNMQQRWITKSDPDPTAEFSCVANVGIGGPGDAEMPLGAVRDAFEERVADGTNAGFHRSDALLGIVMLTDEEDCSYEQSITLGTFESLCESKQEPVANYVQFLDTFTGNRTRWATAVIAGLGPGQCSSAFGNADEATRLKDFVQQTGPNAAQSSICDGDLSIGLMKALMVFDSACGGVIF